MTILAAWARAFLLTQLVEVPVYLVAQRAFPRGWAARFLVATLASTFTHPLVWWVMLGPLRPLPWEVSLVIVEVGACVIEAIWLWRLGVGRALGWAVAANGLSLGVGLGLRWLGVPV